MPINTLKPYQQATLDSLRAFARSAQFNGLAMAFGEPVRRPYPTGRSGALTT